MHNAPKHISHIIRQVFSHNTHYPPQDRALMSLPARTYKTFRQLVIPASDGITTLEWVLVRYDCVFLIESYQDTQDGHPAQSCLQDQWNSTRQKAQDLSVLLRRVHYTGLVQSVLVTQEPQKTDVAGDIPILDITELSAYLASYTPLRHVTKPAFAIALCRAIEKCMYAPRYRNLATLRNKAQQENYGWMRNFEPPVITSSQRDFAFRQALYPQAIYIPGKGK